MIKDCTTLLEGIHHEFLLFLKNKFFSVIGFAMEMTYNSISIPIFKLDESLNCLYFRSSRTAQYAYVFKKYFKFFLSELHFRIKSFKW